MMSTEYICGREMGGGRKFYHTSARCTWIYLSYVVHTHVHTIVRSSIMGLTHAWT